MDELKRAGGQEEQANGSVERILRVATALFAEHGFHGVSTRAIASAAGLNIATVNYHVGGKQDLYRAVFHRLFLQEYELVSRFVQNVPDEVVHSRDAFRDLLIRLVDALVDMTRENPDVPRLWIRRWLERDLLADDIESQFSLPLYRMVRDLLERARQAGTIRTSGPDVLTFLISFSWMLYGYFTGGAITWNVSVADPLDPEQIAAFKAFLHDYLCRMLDL